MWGRGDNYKRQISIVGLRSLLKRQETSLIPELRRQRHLVCIIISGQSELHSETMEGWGEHNENQVF